LFLSESSPGLSKAFQEIANDIASRHNLGEQDLLIDVGANDGTWLQCFYSTRADLLAVEPAPKPASIAANLGIAVINDYFSSDIVFDSGLMKKSPRLVSLNYVFANIPSPKETLRQIIEISDNSTVISIMTGYHPSQLQVSMFDYVYHEHLSYFSCRDFQTLAEELGLVITYARETPLKGGSLHIEMQLKSDLAPTSEIFSLMLKREHWLDSPIDNQWASIASQIDHTRELVQKEIGNARSRGLQIVGYGASHSTTTLSFALGIASDLDLIVDDNAHKFGLFAPGTGVPVKHKTSVIGSGEVLIIVLAWQHEPLILESIRSLGVSGEILVPFPSLYLEKLG
jgi:hypothetical protein